MTTVEVPLDVRSETFVSESTLVVVVSALGSPATVWVGDRTTGRGYTFYGSVEDGTHTEDETASDTEDTEGENN